MFNDTLQGVRKRRGLRWFLVVPTALAGFIAFGIVGAGDTLVAAIWLCDAGYDGGILCFLGLYSAVVLAAIVVPDYKAGMAALIAIEGMVFCYPWLPRGSDFDAYWPNVNWGGSITGGCLAFSLVMLKLRPRWLMLLPAYCMGFYVAGLPSLCLWPGFMTAFCASLGAIILAVWMAPDHKRFVAVGAFLLTTTLGFYTLVTWNGIEDNMGVQSFGGYFFGGAVALALILWRSLRSISPALGPN